VVAHGNLPPTLQHHACAMFDVLRGGGKRLKFLGPSGQGVPMHPLGGGKNITREDVIPQS
jgi:hypothetical protein